MNFFILLSIPLIIIIVNYLTFKINITFKEFIFQVFVQLIIVLSSIFFLYNLNVKDVEIRNGYVMSKTKDRVSCSHSYSCNCVESCSGSGSNRSCSTICQTCYDHSYDIDWNVHTTIGKINISRIDRQGLKEPRRWSRVYKKEAVSLSFSYENYIKGAKDTLFKNKSLINKYLKEIPAYPDKIYDYYNINRFLEVGTNIQEKSVINKEIMEINSRNGSLKEVNFILLTTNKKNREFGDAIEQAWIGGKKNDVILILGLENESKILWVKVLDWSQNTLLKYNLKDEILDLRVFDYKEILSLSEKNIVKYFKRKPMKDFEYLKNRIKPSNMQLAFALFIGVLISILTSFITYRVKMFT